MSAALQLAKHYFDLSNDGNLVEIATLFTPASTYSSSTTGVFLGAAAIMAMQHQFFAGFKTRQWEVQSVEEVKPGIVLFNFTFSGTTLEGNPVNRTGREYVIVYNGKIQHIEVRSNE